MNEFTREVCRQIKTGIDAARAKGVWAAYPSYVLVDGERHAFPWPEPLVPVAVVSVMDRNQ